MSSSYDKGKEKEIRLDPPPPPLDGRDNHSSDDVSDGESYNSGFGSGYSEAGLLDDSASIFDEDDANGSGYSALGSLDDRSSIFEDDFAHGASSESNHSHRFTPSETSTRPKGPVSFSLKPAREVNSRFGKVPSSGASTSRTSFKVLCVICNKKPAYNDGHRTFPTCGNTCAAKLKAARNIDLRSRNKNKTHPPRRSGQRSKYRVPKNAYRKARANAVRMCEVCRVRPRFQKNGKLFPTCGLTCAALLQRPGSVEMCELCKKRPRVVLNGYKFPHCGRRCRDQAKAGVTVAVAEVPSTSTTSTTLKSASCDSCLICWKADRIGPASDLCSNRCKRFADKRAPFLLEIPRGHVTFKEVADNFSASWRSRSPCPVVKKVYMVILKPSFGQKYKIYRRNVSHTTLLRRLFSKNKGNEKRVWLGMGRACGLGDSGNTLPCKSSKCVLCSLVRSSLSQEIAQGGIQTSSSSSKAVEFSKKFRKVDGLKVVLLANVLFGREVEMGIHELVLPLPPEFDSVHLVERRLVGGKIDHGESLVFDGDAIKPLYLISY